MNTEKKLSILAESAKYDLVCGNDTKYYACNIKNSSTYVYNAISSDGRCVPLIKVLLSNNCVYDCKYCINRTNNDIQRISFSPKELANLTFDLYNKGYIEGLFLSSGIIKSPDYTMEIFIKTLELLRYKFRFLGYIHTKIIPGSSEMLIKKVAILSNRISANIELPSEKSLKKLAPNKSKHDIFSPFKIYKNMDINKKHSMTTQVIIGASEDNDYTILKLSDNLYKKMTLKRVYYSAYLPVNKDDDLPSLSQKPPFTREHRLYQADWLLREYGFSLEEITSEDSPFLSYDIDPKLSWTLKNLHLFPIDINVAEKEMLLRVPGLGIKYVDKIIKMRRFMHIDFDIMKKMGISLKHAQFFLYDKRNGNYDLEKKFKKGLIQEGFFKE